MIAAEDTAASGKSFCLTLRHDFVISDGKLIECEGIDAIKGGLRKYCQNRKRKV